MLDQDVDPDLKDDNGVYHFYTKYQDHIMQMTPLMRACASRRHDVVRLLLDYKVETNSKDNDGRNALHHVCIYRNALKHIFFNSSIFYRLAGWPMTTPMVMSILLKCFYLS